LVAVLDPASMVEGDRGEGLRRFGELLVYLEELCPWVTPIALGVCTFPARGPSRLLGGDHAVVAAVHRHLNGWGATPAVGIAPGLFAALLAARSGAVVADGTAAAFLHPFEVGVLDRPKLTALLPRLGVSTLGAFAALEPRAVYARFGPDALTCHRVASGAEGELAGLRDPAILRRLAAHALRDAPPAVQVGFDGGTDLGAHRAASAARRLQRRHGPEAVLVARLRGGRAPGDRGDFLPFGATTVLDDASSPWPAQLPAPSPARVYADPRAVDVHDEAGRSLLVGRSGLLSASPRLLLASPGRSQRIVDWAGPWPTVERWWAEPRRRARLQVVTEDGVAQLLTFEGRRWWLEAVYD
jgi:hypothetical protein